MRGHGEGALGDGEAHAEAQLVHAYTRTRAIPRRVCRQRRVQLLEAVRLRSNVSCLSVKKTSSDRQCEPRSGRRKNCRKGQLP